MYGAMRMQSYEIFRITYRLYICLTEISNKKKTGACETQAPYILYPHEA